MTLKRKIYDKLLAWKHETNGRRALLVEGARRIGKSTIVEEFGKNEYQSYILINFSNVESKIKKYFYDYMDNLDMFFMMLSSATGVRLYERKSLIILDEVQVFPRARECIKFLVQDGRYDYIETGSLISIHENVKDIVIPSEERSISMYPMDFEEFCTALGYTDILEYIERCYQEKRPLERGLHEQAMMLFKQYMLVGGMPRSVLRFIQGRKDFAGSDEEKRDILALYRKDIMKIKSSYKAKVLTIFDQIPGFLSKHEKRVVLSSIEKGSNIDQYERTFFWLSDSMICNVAFNTTDPGIGLSINEDRTYVKCYMGDTGLLVSHSFTAEELSSGSLYDRILNDKLSINEGMFFENAIAQILVANGHKPFFYTRYNPEKHRNDIEIDFLISNGSKMNYKVSPLEVKSSRKYTITSLERFENLYRKRIDKCVVIHPKNLSEREGVLYIPAYMAFCLR